MKVTSTSNIYRHLKPLGVRFLLAGGILLFLVAMLGIRFLANMAESDRLNRLVTAKRSILDAFNRTEPNPPSRLRVDYLNMEASKLAELALSIRQKPFFWTRFNFSDKERLEFKESIFDLNQRLEQSALEQGVSFGAKAQLPLFENFLPSGDDLPKLFMAMKLSEELRSEIIAARMPVVEQLNFPEAEMTPLGVGLKRYRYTFKVKMEAPWESLLMLLGRLAQSQYLWRIEKMDLENRPAEAAGGTETGGQPPAAQTQMYPWETAELAANQAAESDQVKTENPLNVFLELSGTFYAKEARA